MKPKYIIFFIVFAAALLFCKVARDINTAAGSRLAAEQSTAAAGNAARIADQKAAAAFREGDARRARDAQFAASLGMTTEQLYESRRLREQSKN